MSYLAQGLSNGFQAGFGAANQRRRDKAQADRDAEFQKVNATLQAELLEKRQKGENDTLAAAETLRKERELAAFMRQQNDPRDQLARKQAQSQLDTFGQPKPMTVDEVLAAEVNRMKLTRERDELAKPPVAPVPTAKVRQPIGPKGAGGYAEFEAPVDQVPNLARSAAAEGWRSPYTKQLATLEKTIADEQAALDNGDTRTGFMGVGTSRADTVAKAQRERLRLQGLELQDKVRVGILTQEEADAEADKLMSGTR